ncbi:MAG TPA: hypothetical protein VFC89_02520, partial [Oscillospiraceae bacterium]|nr:hypothetical protein [Oscillospiraceae bacterium]
KTTDLFDRFEKLERDSKVFLSTIIDEGIVKATLSAFAGFPTQAVGLSDAVKLTHGQEIRILPDNISVDTITFTYNSILLAVAGVNRGLAKVKRVFIDSSAEFLREGSIDEDM